MESTMNRHGRRAEEAQKRGIAMEMRKTAASDAYDAGKQAKSKRIEARHELNRQNSAKRRELLKAKNEK
jgi:hypothetical protein